MAERSWDGSLACPALPFSLLVIQRIKTAGYKATDGDFIHSLCFENRLRNTSIVIIVTFTTLHADFSLRWEGDLYGSEAVATTVERNTVLIVYPHYSSKKTACIKGQRTE